MSMFVNYAIPSAFQATPVAQTLGLAANMHRPVRFHASVKPAARLGFRFALTALGKLIWSDDTWLDEDTFRSLYLDPIITVHPDRVFFEALSGDLSAYGIVIVDRACFDAEGAVEQGTTNIDFTASLAAALGEMRSTRPTHLRIGPEGFAVSTEGGGGRFEEKVEIPVPWVRALLQTQLAMALPGTRLDVRPVDLLAATRFLEMNRANLSPRALRYEFPPNAPASLVLEPWEHVVPLKGTAHNYTAHRSIRTWGRRRLSLLAPLLPYAETATVYLKGRAMPSFYALRLGNGIEFILGLTGWTANARTSGEGFAAGLESDEVPEARIDAVLSALADRTTATTLALAQALGLQDREVLPALSRLCRRGRAMYDVERREFRHRELFAQPIDEAKYFPPDPRTDALREILRGGRATLLSASPRETRKESKQRNPLTGEPVVKPIVLTEWQYGGRVDEFEAVEAVVTAEGRLIFGKCGCTFFRENYLTQGPCEHIAAIRRLGEDSRSGAPEAPPTE